MDEAGNIDGRIKLEYNRTATLIRKSASTGIREAKSSYAKEVADVMMHSEKTAKEHYFFRDMRASVLKGGQALRSHFLGEESCTITSASQTYILVEASLIISPKKKWNKDEVDEVKRLFPSPTISVKDIKEKVELCNVSPKQIYNKVHSLTRYSPSIKIPEIPENLSEKKLKNLKNKSHKCMNASV